MRVSRPSFRAIVVSSTVALSVVALGVAVFVLRSVNPTEVAGVQVSSTGSCALNQPALCETFDQPAGTGNRSGQLNGTLWGVSRTLGGSGANFGQSLFSAFSTTQLQTCSGTTTVTPPNDVIICNGQVREAVNDNTDVTSLAMYPKQPFDFAGRTGTIAFDVSNDTQGIHTMWPEVWIADQPVPNPFRHFGAFGAGRNSLGIRLGAATVPFQGHNIGGACPDDGNNRWSVDSMAVTRNYTVDDSEWQGTIKPRILDCVIASPLDSLTLNHVEIHVSQSTIDVYATDAGTTAPLHHLATLSNANLTLTRGLVWMEDVHYNADKDGTHNQRQHTFAWDNFAFDGPVLARDLAFDALDALVPVAGYPGLVNLGWHVAANATVPLSIPGVTGIQNATGALLTFGFYHLDVPPFSITYTVNGHVHTQAWPYPEVLANSIQTLAIPVPLSDVVVGTNTVSISASQDLSVNNVDLVLVAAGSAGSGPTATPVPPAPTATPTAVNAATSTAVPSATVEPGDTATPLPAEPPTKIPAGNGCATSDRPTPTDASAPAQAGRQCT